MTAQKRYNFKPGDTVIHNGSNGWSFTHEGDELVIHEIRGDGSIGILAKDHPDKRAIVRDNPNFVWWYHPHSFYPYPVERVNFKFSLDSVFK